MSKKQSNLRWVLLPFALLYGLVIGIRNWLFDLGILNSKEFDVPTISVGNITVGGTGKTPHVEYLISILKDNFKIATLSRGYKRKTKNFIIARTDSTVDEIGDESLQVKQKFPDIEVAVDKKRVNGVSKLISKDFETAFDAIILDDAFQHRWIKPGLSILLIDYNRPMMEDFLLPVGTLREVADNRHRANIIIMAKSPLDMKPIEHRLILKRLNLFPYQNLYFTTFKYNDPEPVFNSAAPILNIEELKMAKQSILLVTGIAYPEPLIEYLKKYSSDIHHFKYKDHHSFSKKNIVEIEDKFNSINNDQKIILTTEKDAARLRDNQNITDTIKNKIYLITVEIEFLRNEAEVFNKQINDYVRKNKRNYGLHKSKSRL